MSKQPDLLKKLDIQFFGEKPKPFFEIKASADGKSADIFILGVITKWAWEEEGEMSSVLFKEKLDAIGDVATINLYINSPGGSVFEGIAIANFIKSHKARVIGHVVALAASIASNILASCDEIRMYENSMLMIHNAINRVEGNADELRKAADDLDRINEVQVTTYMAKIGNKTSETELRALMKAESWLSAKEAQELGLCDVIEGANNAVAEVDEAYLATFKNVPDNIRAMIKQSQQPEPTAQMSDEEKALREKILADSKANLTNLQLLLGGI